MVAVVLAGCAPPRGVGSPSASPSAPAARASADVEAPLLAVLDAPFGAAPNTLRLTRTDGIQVAQVPVDPDAEAIAVVGSQVLVAGAGRMTAIQRDGTSTALPALPGDAQLDLVRGLSGSPDGTRWMWASVGQGADGLETSRLYVSAHGGAAPRLVLTRSLAGAALQPVAWTAGGAVVSEEPVGIGGYVLFRRTFGATSLLDVGSGAVRTLTPADCAFSDLAADGTVACISDGREGPHGDAPVALHLRRAGRADMVVRLPGTVRQAGAALFAPGGRVLSLATSPALGEGAERIEMDLVDVATGTRRVFGPAGLMPVQWLDEGSLVAVRLPGVAGGAAGTYVVDRAGDATLVAAASTVVGVVR
jgi:hypothetical protein